VCIPHVQRAMALDSEPAPVEEQGEEEEEKEWKLQLDAPAHHPSAPPDEVAINGSDFTWFLFCSFFLLNRVSVVRLSRYLIVTVLVDGSAKILSILGKSHTVLGPFFLLVFKL
jgi:hypothetical protein